MCVRNGQVVLYDYVHFDYIVLVREAHSRICVNSSIAGRSG